MMWRTRKVRREMSLGDFFRCPTRNSPTEAKSIWDIVDIAPSRPCLNDHANTQRARLGRQY